VILIFATGVALAGFALSCVVIGIYRLVDQVGMQQGWWS
jgi:hypothetical protein